MGCKRLKFFEEPIFEVVHRRKKYFSSKKRIGYYPGGMAMPGRSMTGANQYRYGYQGQYAETDPETGKPAFELRLYDPRINRWLSPDPYGQYASPYLGMGNDWANGVDSDGGWKTKFGAWLYKTFNGGGEIVGEKGNWSVAQRGADGWDTFITNDLRGYNNNAAQMVWNHDVTRAITGDKIDIGLTGDAFGSFFGFQGQVEATWLLRGEDASFLPYITGFPPNVGVSVGAGADIGGSLEFSRGYFNGSVEEIKAQTLLGLEGFIGGDIRAEVGLSAEVALGYDFESKRVTWTTTSVGLDVGAGAKIEAGVRAHVSRFHFTKGLLVWGLNNNEFGAWK